MRLVQLAFFTLSALATCGLAVALAPALLATGRLWPVIAALVITKTVVFELFGLHRASWRWFDLADAAVITIANTGGSVLAALALGPLIVSPDLAAILVMDWFVTQGIVLETRLLYRLQREKREKLGKGPPPRRILIFGATRGGIELMRRLSAGPAQRYEVAGFIDDDEANRHAMIQMTPVLGNSAELPRLAKLHGIQEILVPCLSARSSTRARIRELATFAGVRCRFLGKRGSVRRKQRQGAGNLQSVSANAAVQRASWWDSRPRQP